VALVPGGVGVSASNTLVPHLTHRTTIYEFPNPWVVGNWLDHRTKPDPAKVDYLVVDRTSNPDRVPFVRELTRPGGPFRILFDDDQVVVAKRVEHPSTANGDR
jgi:hypothetical protein